VSLEAFSLVHQSIELKLKPSTHSLQYFCADFSLEWIQRKVKNVFVLRPDQLFDFRLGLIQTLESNRSATNLNRDALMRQSQQPLGKLHHTWHPEFPVADKFDLAQLFSRASDDLHLFHDAFKILLVQSKFQLLKTI
jgi:hypothetical protein